MTTLFNFDGSNGAFPDAGLTADANGNLFGITSQGGANDEGAVFEIKNIGTMAAPLYADSPIIVGSFNGSNDVYPCGEVTIDADGNLLGTTQAGGTADDGTVFEIANTGTVAAPNYASTPTTLVSFDSLGGYAPDAGLIADAKGDLFGTTLAGGVKGNGDGTVFEIKNTGTAATPIYASTPIIVASFNGLNGANPEDELNLDASGDLLGTTVYGGANDDGTVFEIKNTGTVAAPIYASTPITLVSFNGPDGANPFLAGLTADANGNLFGTTDQGGANDDGTVFEIKNTGTLAAPIYSSPLMTLISFDGSDGLQPAAGLTVDANGNLFGTTAYGGVNNDGTIFEIKNDGSLIAPVYASIPVTLVNFNGSDGACLSAGLTADANGNLLGTTYQGGATGDGTVFDISLTASVPTITGTIGGQMTTLEAPLQPFANVSIEDYNAGATDTLSITLSGAGGTLSGEGLSSRTNGVYALTGTASVITTELDALVFTPNAAWPNPSATTTFTLSDWSDAGSAPALDATTTVIDNDCLDGSSELDHDVRWIKPGRIRLERFGRSDDGRRDLGELGDGRDDYRRRLHRLCRGRDRFHRRRRQHDGDHGHHKRLERDHYASGFFALAAPRCERLDDDGRWIKPGRIRLERFGRSDDGRRDLGELGDGRNDHRRRLHRLCRGRDRFHRRRRQRDGDHGHRKRLERDHRASGFFALAAPRCDRTR